MWELKGEVIDVPLIRPAPMREEVLAMLDEAEETLAMAIEAPER